MEFPDSLREDTVEQIKAIIRRFETDKNLDKLDTIALNAFARDLDLYYSLDEMLSQQKKNGYLQMSDRGNFTGCPYFDMRMKMERQMFAWMRDFGLTMASRGKIKGGEDPAEDSPLMEFMRGGK